MDKQINVNVIEPQDVAVLLLQRREPLFILDVRSREQFEAWHIEGEQAAIMHVPYFELLDDVSPVLPHIPKERKVVVVCNKGNSSAAIARLLMEQGITHIFSMEGGMNRWGEVLVPISAGRLSGGGEIIQFIRPGKGCLSYMLLSGEEAIVVDPARMIEPYVRAAEERGATITHVLDSHLHADHISGGRKLAEQTGAAYWLPSLDAAKAVFRFNKLDQETGQITADNGRLAIRPLFTPGHTGGSMSFIVDEAYLLSGDTLFVASIGRPDLAGHAKLWAKDLHHTLYTLYRMLPADLIVLPGHYGHFSELDGQGAVSARLGDLYARNPGLTMDSASFMRRVTEQLPAQPNRYADIRQINLGKQAADEAAEGEMELGPNRCAVHAPVQGGTVRE